jgi:hypothetical protein
MFLAFSGVNYTAVRQAVKTSKSNVQEERHFMLSFIEYFISHKVMNS